MDKQTLEYYEREALNLAGVYDTCDRGVMGDGHFLVHGVIVTFVQRKMLRTMGMIPLGYPERSL